MPRCFERPRSLWQHPFVDVFKVFGGESAEHRGNVGDELDKQICKKVFRIRGSVSANNFIRLPHPKGSVRTLGLTGEHIYIEAKSLGESFFLVHLDFTVAVVNVLRVTLSNIYSEVKATYRSVQYPCPLSSQWTVICLHVPSVLALCTQLPPHSFVLKTVQLCASMYVRSIYTSDVRYTVNTLPREMLFENQHSLNDTCLWIDIPGVVAKGFELPGAPVTVQKGSTAGNTETISQGLDVAKGISDQSTTEHDGLSSSSHRAQGITATSLCSRKELVGGATGMSSVGGRALTSVIPDPMLEVSRIIGVSRRNRKVGDSSESIPRRFAVFVRTSGCSSEKESTNLAVDGSVAFGAPDVNSSVLCASSMTLILMEPPTWAQRCFFGHTCAIELLESSDDGLWAVSAQNAEDGAPPVLRLWRAGLSGGIRCAAVLSCLALGSARTAAFDPLSRHLVLCGTDVQGRQQMLVWDISRVGGGGNITMVARQVSADWDIDCTVFSPFEELKVVTCGREGIRFWRIKDGHMPGRSVTLNALARQNHFTSIGFEFNKLGRPYVLGEHLGNYQRMFVGTAKGHLVQLSYIDCTVQAVYELHANAITSICANEGFVVTASADGYVRVWPLDFKSFILHVMHESTVVGVDITVDGLQALCCTADGSIGLLNIQSHAYTDLFRSHGARVVDAAVSLFFQELATVSNDGILKVWSLKSTVCTHDFAVPADKPCAVAYHPGNRHIIAVGFQSGTLRIFDVDGPTILHEMKHHSKSVLALAFVRESPDRPSMIVTCGASGSLVFHDEAHNFEVVRSPHVMPTTNPPLDCMAMVCIPPRLLQYLDTHTVALFSFPKMALIDKLHIQSSEITAVNLSFRACFAVLGTADSRIHLFLASTGAFMFTYSLASGPLSAVAMTSFELGTPYQGVALVISSAGDSLIRLAQLQSPDSPLVLKSSPLQSRAGDERRKVPAVLYDHLHEQAFIGHSRSPHRVLIMPSVIISVSTFEVICWSTAGNYFEQLYLDEFLGPKHASHEASEGFSASRICKQDRVKRSQVFSTNAVCKQDSVKQSHKQEPSSKPEIIVPPLDVLDSNKTDSMAPSGGVPEEAVSEVPVSPDTDVQSKPPPQSYRLDDVHETQSTAGGAPLLSHLHVQPAVDADLSFAETGPEIEQTAVKPHANTSNDLSCGRPSDAIKPCVQKVGLRMQSFCGCDVSRGTQTIAWKRRPGWLCHVLGNMVHVEKLLDSNGAAFESTSSATRTTSVLKDLPGSEVLAIDLSVLLDNSCLIAVLSLGAGHGQPRAWLSAWCADNLEQKFMSELPAIYATLPHGVPLMRLLSHGQKVVTATATGSGGNCGRIDVWRFTNKSCLLSSSAQLWHIPLDLLVLPREGDEFLTLGSRSLVFWRCPQEGTDADQGVSELQFQLAEEPQGWSEDGKWFTAFCAVELNCFQFLLVGTDGGHMYAYNADENIVLAELQVTKGDSIEALACTQWPMIICCSGKSVFCLKMMTNSDGHLFVEQQTSIMRLDGHARVLLLDGMVPDEGLVATSTNSLWYFRIDEGAHILLNSFHSTPSRVSRSNVQLVDADLHTGGHHREVSKIIATCADDGCIRLWSYCEQGQHVQALAQVSGETTCTEIVFLGPDMLACSFLSGYVSVFNLSCLKRVGRVEVNRKDPLLAMEALSLSSVVVGSACGQVVELRMPSCHTDCVANEFCRSVRHFPLRVPQPGSTVCGISCNRVISPNRFLVGFSCLEVWVWECPTKGCKPRHSCTFVWPETMPKPSAGDCSKTEAWCLEYLSSPPLVTCFVPASGADDVIAITAAPARCLYLFSCERQAIINRVTLHPQLPAAILRLWPLQVHSKASSGADASGRTTLLFVICSDCFVSLVIQDKGVRANWTEVLQLPGRSLGGVPDACLLHYSGEECRFLLKSDVAFSCWAVSC